jgi:hypothetical protein
MGWHDLVHRVRYQNVTALGRDGWPLRFRRLIFSMPWLCSLYDTTLASFEARCIREHRAPVDEEE